MVFFNNLSFSYPYLLILIFFLPLLWKLLKISPLSTLLKKFPAIVFLATNKSIDQTPEKEFYPIVILRILIFIFLIFALSDPFLNKDNLTKSNYLIIVDNNWLSASNWNIRKNKIIKLIDSNNINETNFKILTTTEYSKNNLLGINETNSKNLIDFVNSLQPFPWESNYELVKEKIKSSKNNYDNIFWFTEKTMNNEKLLLFQHIKNSNLKLIVSDESKYPPIVKLSQSNEDLYKLMISSFIDNFSKGIIDCYDLDGRLLYRINYEEKSKKEKKMFVTETKFFLPISIKNKIDYFKVNSSNAPSAKIFLSETHKKKTIGIFLPKTNNQISDFERGNYFIKKALERRYDLIEADIEELINKDLKLIFVDDLFIIEPKLETKILNWIENGGTLVRSGGPILLKSLQNKKYDTFSYELSLSEIATTLESELSLKKSLKVKNISLESPLYGLKPPNETIIWKYIQKKNDISPDNIESWLKLENGADLITASLISKGKVVFFHVPLNGNWSNLSLSYFFIEVLDRIINLSKGVKLKENRFLKPLLILDGFGELQQPSPQVLNFKNININKRLKLDYSQPPGLYKDSEGVYALNLGKHLPNNINLYNFDDNLLDKEFTSNYALSLRSPLLIISLILFLLDTLITMYKRQLFRFNKKYFSITILLLFFNFSPCKSNQIFNKIELTKIGYILTGEEETDAISKNGLEVISKYITSKTASIIGKPESINLKKDELSFFPLIYWPIGPNLKNISKISIQKVKNFILDGGLLMIDCKLDSYNLVLNACTDNFQTIIGGNKLSDFSLLDSNHAIAKSFYLLNNFPGRKNGKTYVAYNISKNNDNAISVIISNNDWSGAWAKKNNNNFSFPLLDSLDRQRIISMRFGVNLLIYALTGNYKTDQVHIPEILKRMEK